MYPPKRADQTRDIFCSEWLDCSTRVGALTTAWRTQDVVGGDGGAGRLTSDGLTGGPLGARDNVDWIRSRALMNEFHTSNLLQSVAIEGLVLHPVICEKALTLSKKNRGPGLIKQFNSWVWEAERRQRRRVLWLLKEEGCLCGGFVGNA